MKNKTDITIILDRSGSMESVKQDTIGGFNNFLREQRQVAGAAALTLVQFDNEYEIVYEDRPLAAADPLDESTFQPRGMTALYDAVGRTIDAIGGRLAALPESERPDKVIVVIVTDGHENASGQYGAAQVGAMIAHQRDVYKWEFMFLGANQDAILSAGEIGIPRAAALTYAANSEGQGIAFSLVNTKVRRYRRSNDAEALRFTEEERARQREAGAEH